MNDKTKSLLLWVGIGFLLMLVFSNMAPQQTGYEEYPYSRFVNSVRQGDVSRVVVSKKNNMQHISGITNSGSRFSTWVPLQDDALMGELINNNVEISGQPEEQQSLLMSIFISWFPMLLLIGLWFWFLRQMQGGGGAGGRPMSFARSRARMLEGDQVKVTFNDVSGVDEAKQDVQEFVDFLKDPSKYQKLGGKIPCGALLVGSPGTGKTLLAKAVAGEANVPFFSISGSDFVEMFVGVGASRVRDMFEQAKKQAPCIIFIDEIDAVGRHRGAGLGGGHDEREQTLNQLLVEMDGFEGKEGIIVMAATNRPDVLDPALLRPGRFDRQVMVQLPDILGRDQILKVHVKKISLGQDVETKVVARGTPGFSGADLANLVNEAALFAARANKSSVGMDEFEKARDKIIMGAERRSMVMTDEEKKLTAYHEAGHALVGLYVPNHDPVYKVTIIPRGRALGVTMYLPEQDQRGYSVQQLESKVSTMYGGRVAEELIFGAEHVTTGASNDIEKASKLVRAMITEYGLSKNLGPINFSDGDQQEVFLGKSVGQSRNYSPDIAIQIDKEVREIVDRNYIRAEKILKEHLGKLHTMAEALMKFETLYDKQIKQIIAGEVVSQPEGWRDDGQFYTENTSKSTTEDDTAK
ncbi:MAG: ATP-dependent metalloprotease [Legionellales bacterium]|nr:ATP-dependent metalloprotease [Legionellales bacterium]